MAADDQNLPLEQSANVGLMGEPGFSISKGNFSPRIENNTETLKILEQIAFSTGCMAWQVILIAFADLAQ